MRFDWTDRIGCVCALADDPLQLHSARSSQQGLVCPDDGLGIAEAIAPAGQVLQCGLTVDKP
jgi:hypothetical protein